MFKMTENTLLHTIKKSSGKIVLFMNGMNRYHSLQGLVDLWVQVSTSEKGIHAGGWQVNDLCVHVHLDERRAHLCITNIWWFISLRKKRSIRRYIQFTHNINHCHLGVQRKRPADRKKDHPCPTWTTRYGINILISNRSFITNTSINNKEMGQFKG